MVSITLTRAEDGFIDYVENPTRDQVQKAFENLSPNNTEIYLWLDLDSDVRSPYLHITIDTTGTSYVVSQGDFYMGKRVINVDLIGRNDEYAMRPLKYYAQNGEGYSSYLKETISKEEAERVLLYFFEHRKLPDDVTLL
ncbi:MAG: hypothetical protein RLP44_33085 [Aggregatilineales bacterium]